MTKEKKKEFTLRISQAGEGGLTVILYEITLEYLKDARESFQKGDLDSFTEDIHHAQDCIRLQQSSLQMGYEPASTLLSLYVYLHAELSKALIEMDASHLDICEKVDTGMNTHAHMCRDVGIHRHTNTHTCGCVSTSRCTYSVYTCDVCT